MFHYFEKFSFSEDSEEEWTRLVQRLILVVFGVDYSKQAVIVGRQ